VVSFQNESALDPFQHLSESLASERLQNVVEGFQLKDSHGVIVISGSEDNFRIVLDILKDVQTAKSWHSHIQKDEVGPQFIYQSHRAVTVRRLANEVQPALARQKVLDRLTG